jgi:diguanylate cyclase (GGDEF)-like protein
VTATVAPGDEDLLTDWDADPSPAHPHVALLLGGSLLAVTLVCVLPVLVLGIEQPGMKVAYFALTVTAAIAGVAPFVSVRGQTPRYAVLALVIFDALPLLMAIAANPDTPVRQWASLVLIPVLLTASTASPHLFHVEVGAGAAVGVALLAWKAPTVIEGLLTCGGFLIFILVCASLTRRDWSILHDRFDELQRRTRTDELTGLRNRRGFVAEFPAVRKLAAARGSALGMVLIDIDHFSRINAAHGHAYGDAVLQRLCTLVLGVPAISEGVVARIGGEEIVVVVPQPAAAVAAVLRREIGRAAIHPGLTVSMGISDTDPESCSGADALWRLVNLTDSAMYQAKQSGRDRIVSLSSADVVQEQTATVTGTIAARGEHVANAASGARDQPFRERASDHRFLGIYSVGLAVIGWVAYLWPIALDPASRWTPVFLVLLTIAGALGVAAIVRGPQLSTTAVGALILAMETATVSAALATPDLEHRMLEICVMGVPVLVAAQTVGRRWLVAHVGLVFLGSGLAAVEPPPLLDAAWMYRTVSLAIVIGTAPAVLFWLRERRATANARLRMLAATDPLTGVRNRPGLERALISDSEGDEAPRYHVLSINIDGFKGLNDSYGHVFGDQALAELAHALTKVGADLDARARRLTSEFDPADQPDPTPTLIARTGGDRFVVVTRGEPDPTLVSRVRHAVGDLSVKLTVSLGEASGPVATPAQLWSVVAAADADLAQSKVLRGVLHR